MFNSKYALYSVYHWLKIQCVILRINKVLSCNQKQLRKYKELVFGLCFGDYNKLLPQGLAVNHLPWQTCGRYRAVCWQCHCWPWLWFPACRWCFCPWGGQHGPAHWRAGGYGCQPGNCAVSSHTLRSHPPSSSTLSEPQSKKYTKSVNINKFLENNTAILYILCD